MNREEKFEQWFDTSFLFTRNPSSIALNIQDKREILKQNRVKAVCLLLLNNKTKDKDLRKEIALAFFVSMRVALDYLNYSKMVLAKYEETK